jgi:hypothetical protein
MEILKSCFYVRFDLLFLKERNKERESLSQMSQKHFFKFFKQEFIILSFSLL